MKDENARLERELRGIRIVPPVLVPAPQRAAPPPPTAAATEPEKPGTAVALTAIQAVGVARPALSFYSARVV